MKPLYHAKNSVKKYGGKLEDYLKIHEWFDQTKMVISDYRHRAVLHNAFGIYLCAQVFGDILTNSDGKKISVRDIGEDHVLEDLGHIPTLEKALQHLPMQDWMTGNTRKSAVQVIYVD